jgi:hypothetical protein
MGQLNVTLLLSNTDQFDSNTTLVNLAPFDFANGHGPHNLMKFIADDYWSESNPNPEC